MCRFLHIKLKFFIKAYHQFSNRHMNFINKLLFCQYILLLYNLLDIFTHKRILFYIKQYNKQYTLLIIIIPSLRV